MTELQNYITTYFGPLPDQDLENIGNLFHREEIKKGNYYLRSGDQCEKMSFISSGYLRLFVNTDSKEVTQWIAYSGYFVTELSSFLLGSPSRWNIQALEDTRLFTIRKHEYQKIETMVPQWANLEKLFITKCFTMLEDRVFSHLSMTAEERYNFFYTHHKELFNRVPLQYIASLLGMTPETFSRIRRKHLS